MLSLNDEREVANDFSLVAFWVSRYNRSIMIRFTWMGVCAVVATAGWAGAVASWVLAEEGATVMHATSTGPWNVEQLINTVPQAHRAEGFENSDLNAVFIDALPYHGNPSRFFAYYAVPPEASADNPVPGIVLVHGGGGTAHARWVRMWLKRGFAAIAIDTNGNMPASADSDQAAEPVPNPQGGPKGSDYCFTQLDEPIEDQWAYHAVANIMLTNSFLRSLPGVDAERVGITGISWGGYLTCIAVGVDPRFRFGVPVYGCGFLADDSGWAQRFADMGPQRQALWRKLWDPANYLPRATLPMLWLNGDMDLCFSLKIMRQSFRLPAGERYLSIQPAMAHSHVSGENPPEIPVFVDHVVRNGPPLARCAEQGYDAGRAWAKFADAGDVKQARCVYTTDAGRWIGRTWTPVEAQWNASQSQATFALPQNATAFYFVITDAQVLMSSSEPVDVK